MSLLCDLYKFLQDLSRSDQDLTRPCKHLASSYEIYQDLTTILAISYEDVRTNDPQAWSTCKNLKHQVRKLIRAAESEFIKDQIQNNPRNTNCIWKAIRLCIPKRSASPKVYSKEDNIGADTFNNFFALVGKSTTSKIEFLAEENNFDLNNSIFTPRSRLPADYTPFCYINHFFHLQHSQGSGKQPKLHLFPNRAITNYRTMTDQSHYYLRCQRSARES